MGNRSALTRAIQQADRNPIIGGGRSLMGELAREFAIQHGLDVNRKQLRLCLESGELGKVTNPRERTMVSDALKAFGHGDVQGGLNKIRDIESRGQHLIPTDRTAPESTYEFH